MKELAAFFLFGLIGINSNAQSGIPTFELHVSGSHTLENESGDRTFYGGGLGANVIFGDAHTISFKTGLEGNFFHT
ncbi:hypothetical protein D3C87_308390 [compost metagenome]